VHDQRHGRSSYSEQLRKFLLRQRQDVSAHSIVDVEKPSRQTGVDRVQRIAGGHVLELRQEDRGMGLDRILDRVTVADGRMKSCRRNLQ
jgi:hypothetical protein